MNALLPPVLRSIALVVYDGCNMIGAAGPAEVFALANSALALTDQRAAYQVICVSLRGGLVGTSSSLWIQTESLSGLAVGSIDTLIVAGSPRITQAAQDAQLIDWLSGAARHARRVCSIGTGSFFLAAAGLLNGKRAITNAKYGSDFRARFPRVRLEDNLMYVQSGKFWTAAGMTASIDLSLALVRADLGPQVGVHIAKTLLVFMVRAGSQTPQSTLLSIQERLAQRGSDSTLTDLLGWVATNLGARITVTDLAERAGMSSRSFARFFVQKTGQTPAKLVEQLRLERASHLLETSSASIKSIAAQTGFVDDERMRRAFLRQMGTTPAEYRARSSSLGATDNTGGKPGQGGLANRRQPPT
jgi:transcriptional regulator GlxA family with amidase domain